MRTTTRAVTMLTALALLMSIALPGMASTAAPVDICEQRPDLERCQMRAPLDRCEVDPPHPRCPDQEQRPVDVCRERPDHPRCQEGRKAAFCDREPDHGRCQQAGEGEPVDRCERLADRTRRCITPPGLDYRQLLWRIIHAGDWKMLVRLLIHLGIL